MNMRGDAAGSEVMRDLICDLSTTFCVFVNGVTDELIEFLDNTRSLDKLLLVLLHHQQEEGRIMQQVKDLTRRYRLESTQFICKSALDTNFNLVYEDLKRSISNIITMSHTSCSLMDVAQEAKTLAEFTIDDRNGRIGRAAASKILKDIDACNEEEPRSAKLEVLRWQSDLKTIYISLFLSIFSLISLL